MRTIIQNDNGFIALLSVLILGVITLSITVSILLLGVDALRSAQTVADSTRARGLATLCSERALEEIRQNPLFSGTESIVVSAGYCEYTVSNLGGSNRDIESRGVSGNVTRRVLVEVDQIYPTIHISKWQEQALF
jgi:hypothetical protein